MQARGKLYRNVLSCRSQQNAGDFFRRGKGIRCYSPGAQFETKWNFALRDQPDCLFRLISWRFPEDAKVCSGKGISDSGKVI